MQLKKYCFQLWKKLKIIRFVLNLEKELNWFKDNFNPSIG